MSEKILKALMRLFAIIAGADENTPDARGVVESYLRQLLNNELVHEYLGIYDHYLKQQEEGAQGEKKKRRLAVNSVKVIVICEQINEELTQKQKFIVLINLLEFVNSTGPMSEVDAEFVTTVASSFNISTEEFELCLHLATVKTAGEMDDSPQVLIAGQKRHAEKNAVKCYISETLTGELAVLRINSTGMYLFRYFGNAELFLNGQVISPGRIYILSQGSSLRSSKVSPIYYSDLVSRFLSDTTGSTVTYQADHISYRFKGGKIGLHELSFSETSGRLIGIMGGSGAGKSTLLNILNGNNAPYTGAVLINGYDLHREKEMLEGVIGYIPQDDLLIEELTVYQNLYYNTKLCFQGHSRQEIDRMVNEVLNDLGLAETRDLRVGNPLDKTISGGQRKRLNIALELIRKPTVLFVDEPTSGLSSRDSENIMDLLKGLALTGKLVFVVIHQPSSDIFKMFDKLLILDVGGYPVFYGYPTESVVWFKTRANQVNADESECITCGNVNPEQVFNIIESKVLDENGNQTRNRRVSPKEWNQHYLESLKNRKADEVKAKKEEVKTTFRKPGFFHQFRVFLARDVLSKISNAQYMAINLLEAPILALVLATLIKYFRSGQSAYSFADNKNMPAYLFMCVIVSLFIGLTVSAEEIIRDRKILKRESFLNLSRGSYLLTKMLILFFISAVQTLSFVLIGNYIFGIHGMYFSYWLVLFSTSCFANMLGLNISSSFNTAVTIYILIPFLLIPQLLLSGVIVKFEELHPKISSYSVVPVFGEMMASRWAFEALAVEQYMSNAYEKQVYPLDKMISEASFKKIYWFSKMNDLLTDAQQLKLKDPGSPALEEKLAILKNETKEEGIHYLPFSALESLHASAFNDQVANDLREYLLKVKKKYSVQYDEANREKDTWMSRFDASEDSKAQYLALLADNQNKKIEELVKNVNPDLDPVIEENGRLVPTGDPIFRDGPEDRLVRAHFFAPTKYLFGKLHSTFWVNIFVLWCMSLLMWLTLYFDVLRKVLEFFAALPRRATRK
jgi:ABC-type multidrug transport system ATPase subunit